ncbi:TPA: hypothetical protein DIC40_08475 [Patescibacteria group bacterium]|nr:hypothetical protein [Candidatus Gracilibacteria bacterium]
MEQILRIDADVIVCSSLTRAQQTAESIKKTMTTYRTKDIKLIVDERLGDNE